MLMPSIFGENLLDDFFDYSFGSHKTFDMMNTDIRDTENGYGMKRIPTEPTPAGSATADPAAEVFM